MGPGVTTVTSPIYGAGGPVSVTVNGRIYADGPGSYGIIAQSAGNAISTSPITVTLGNNAVVQGTVGIAVVGGATPGQGGPANSVTIGTGAAVSSTQGASGTAILSLNGLTNVVNNGTVTGVVNLGTSGSTTSPPGDFTNNGTQVFSGTNVVANSSYVNNGTMVIGGAGVVGNAQIVGSLRQYAGGRILVDVDSAAAQTADLLHVTGNVQLNGGVIQVLAKNLLPNAYKVLQVDGALTSSLTAPSNNLVNWKVVAQGNALTITPSLNTHPQSVALSGNESAVADYLLRAWGNSDASLASRFAYLAQINDPGAYRQVLRAYSGQALNSGGATAIASAADMLSAPLSCPVFEGDTAVLTQDNCIWVKTVGGTLRNTGNGGYTASNAMARMGGQHSIAPGLYVGAAFGAGMNNASAENYSGKGGAYDVSASLKYLPGNWEFSSAIALGTATFQNQRYYALPSLGGIAGFSGFNQSNTQTYQAGVRFRGAYNFAFDGWYVRPYADLDIDVLHVPGFSETSNTGSIMLSRLSSTDTLLSLAPMVEVGMRHDVADGWILRPTVAVGMAFQPARTVTTKVNLLGASGLNGTIDSTTTVPSALARMSAGLQIYRAGGFDLRGEYTLATGANFLGQGGYLKAAYHF